MSNINFMISEIESEIEIPLWNKIWSNQLKEKPNHNLNSNSLKEISFDDFLKFTGLTLDDVEYLKTL